MPDLYQVKPMLTAIDATQADIQSAADQAAEETITDIHAAARQDAESGFIDWPRFRRCRWYAAELCRQLDRLADVGRKQTAPTTATTHAWGWVDHEGGNSNWAEDEF